MEHVDERGAIRLQDGFKIFHGTSMANALLITSETPLRPLLEQADDFLRGFNLSVAEMDADPDFAPMREFIFGRNRDRVFSMADSFELASSYALRIPEWQWYLFEFITRKSPLADSLSKDWVAAAEEFTSTQPNPGVLVIQSPVEIPVSDPVFARFRIGGEIRPPIPNPLPPGYEILQIVEIERFR